MFVASAIGRRSWVSFHLPWFLAMLTVPLVLCWWMLKVGVWAAVMLVGAVAAGIALVSERRASRGRH